MDQAGKELLEDVPVRELIPIDAHKLQFHFTVFLGKIQHFLR
jgi:hypothetical protein